MTGQPQDRDERTGAELLDNLREALGELSKTCDHLPFVVTSGMCQCGRIRVEVDALDDELTRLAAPVSAGEPEGRDGV